jgi:hypothetical protein
LFADAEIQLPSLFPREEKGHTNKCHRDNIVGASEKDWMHWGEVGNWSAHIEPAEAEKKAGDSRVPSPLTRPDGGNNVFC